MSDSQNNKKTLKQKFRRYAAVGLLAVLPFAAFYGYEKYEQSNKTPAPTPTMQTTQTTKGQFVENGQDICLYGCPEGAPSKDRIITRSIYVLANNPDTKMADWVGYVVSEQTLGPTQPRVWHRDPELPANETLGPSDYKGIEALHMDRGHQAPVASLTGTADWVLANYLSNITPQMSALNDGAWKAVEISERKEAARAHVKLHPLTGPLFEREMPKLPNAHTDHTIPSGYWKIVAVLDSSGHLRTAAFIFDQNTPSGVDPCNYVVKISVIESKTHLRFFPKLNAAEREQVEQSNGDLAQELVCKPVKAPVHHRK